VVRLEEEADPRRVAVLNTNAALSDMEAFKVRPALGAGGATPRRQAITKACKITSACSTYANHFGLAGGESLGLLQRFYPVVFSP